jgi:hypothetical protein
MIAEERAKVSREYEEQLDRLRNEFEGEAYQRKEQEKRVVEIQNEL